MDVYFADTGTSQFRDSGCGRKTSRRNRSVPVSGRRAGLVLSSLGAVVGQRRRRYQKCSGPPQLVRACSADQPHNLQVSDRRRTPRNRPRIVRNLCVPVCGYRAGYFGLGWPSFRLNSGSKSKISGRILSKSFPGPFSSAKVSLSGALGHCPLAAATQLLHQTMHGLTLAA